MKTRRNADKPVKKRKGARNVAPTEAMEIETVKKEHRKVERRRPERKETDALLHDDLNEFEKQFIQRCRDKGMNDGEIQKWMKEI